MELANETTHTARVSLIG